MKRSISFGCEARSTISADLKALHADRQIDHVQITVPDVSSFATSCDYSTGIPKVVHSNLLNTLGNNNWQSLVRAGSTIAAAEPEHVIEHFTLFRDDSGKKTGIKSISAESFKRDRSRAIENVNRWQDMLGMPIYLENAPVSTDPSVYFECLLEVLDSTQAKLALDVPHFAISFAGIHGSFRDSIAKTLNPKHVHLAALTLRNGSLMDNHHGFSGELAGWAISTFPSIEYCTLEQSSSISNRQISKWLSTLRSVGGLDYNLPSGVSGCDVSANIALAQSESRGLGFMTEARRENYLNDISEELRLFNDLIPFFYPLQTLAHDVHQMNGKEALKKVADTGHLINQFLNLWRASDEFDVVVGYGSSDSELTFARSLVSKRKPTELNLNSFCKFKLQSNEWVGVAVCPV